MDLRLEASVEIKKNIGTPLYVQLKNSIIDKILSGGLKPGSLIKTEAELCDEYKISRYPVRQALGELAKEGYIQRISGKGTFVSTDLPVESEPVSTMRKSKVLGLLLNKNESDFDFKILLGFEKQARKRGYLVTICYSEDSSDEEQVCLDRLLDAGVCGIFIFPSDESRLLQRVNEIKEKGVYLGVIDRTADIDDVDYIGSDNQGGAYAAVRHMAIQGYQNVAFVSDALDVSSIRERFDGYMRAVEDFKLNAVSHIDIEKNIISYNFFDQRILAGKLREELGELRKHTPLGIFAVNDYVAMHCIKIIQAEGLVIGKEIGVVGFDNMIEGEYFKVPLTTVAQNGLLLGQNAADIAINKIEGISNQIYRTVVPTQLVQRSSC